jgi:hypothetical protein
MTAAKQAAALVVGVIILAAATVTAQGKDVLEGAWVQNTAKTTCTAHPGAMCAPAPQKPTRRVYMDMGNGVVFITNDGVNAQGVANGNRIAARRDGKEYPIAAKGQNAYVMIAFMPKSTRPYSADYVTKADGVVTARATETLSADGKTLTITVHNVNPQGQPTTDVVQVWERQ